MRVDFELKGDRRLITRMEKLPGILHINYTQQAKNFADKVMQESAQQVPVDTGTLLNSGFVLIEGDGSVSFGYGGPNDQLNPKTGKMASEYGAAVHEMLSYQHDTGKAKFFEDPLNKAKEELPATVLDKLRKFLNWR